MINYRQEDKKGGNDEKYKRENELQKEISGSRKG
jgi:hypothetical protein